MLFLKKGLQHRIKGNPSLYLGDSMLPIRLGRVRLDHAQIGESASQKHR